MWIGTAARYLQASRRSAAAAPYGALATPSAAMGKSVVKPRRATRIPKDTREKQLVHMTVDEKRLAREMQFDRTMGRTAIAETLGRDILSICRLLAQKASPAPIGRSRALSKGRTDKLQALLEKICG